MYQGLDTALFGPPPLSAPGTQGKSKEAAQIHFDDFNVNKEIQFQAQQRKFH